MEANDNLARAKTMNDPDPSIAESPENKAPVAEKGIVEIKCDPSWSEVLKSPSIGDLCSPSRDMNRSDNLHGLGLQLALARSKSLAVFGRRIAAFLLEIANLYEGFGVATQKACQAIQPESVLARSIIGDVSLKLYKSIWSFSGEVRGLASSYRNRVVPPLQKAVTASGDNINATYLPYVDARRKSFETRQKGLLTRRKYMKAVQDAESVFNDWVRARNEAPAEIPVGALRATDSDLPWERTLKILGRRVAGSLTGTLIQLLKDVQVYQKQYQDFVDAENRAVAHAQEMEIRALQEMQMVEKERLRFFIDSVVARICNAEKEAIEAVVLSPQKASEEDLGKIALENLEKKGKDLLANFFKTNSAVQYEEGMGLMDAETLGLPEDVGLLRDKVKSTFAACQTRIEASEMLAEFLEEMAAAATKLAYGLNTQVRPDDNASQSNGLRAFAESTLSPKAAQLWASTMKIFEDEAVAVFEFAKSLRSLRKEKLGKHLLNAEQELKSATDSDDAAWKRLCEHARIEMKADSRYKQTALQHTKARERVKSVDQLTSRSRSGTQEIVRTRSEDEQEAPITPQKKMTKAFGNMLSGAGAMNMNMLHPDNVRAKLAKSSLNEADQKEAKERQALDEATASKSRAMVAYKAFTEVRLEKYQASENPGWEDMKTVLESVLSRAETFQKARNESLEKSLSRNSESSFDSLIPELGEWALATQQKVNGTIQKMTENVPAASKDEPVFGFSMTVELLDSVTVKTLLALQGTELAIPDLQVDPEPPALEGSEDDKGGAELKDSQIEVQKDKASQNGVADVIQDDAHGSLRIPSSSPGEPEVPKSREAPKSSVEIKHADSMYLVTQNRAGIRQSPEIKAFMDQFWSDKTKDEVAPTIIGIFPCIYRSKEIGNFLAPMVHGRLYTTSESIYFLGLGGKKFVLSWCNISTITTGKGFMGSNDNSLTVTYRGENGESAFLLGRLEERDSVLQHMLKLLDESKASKETVDQAGDGDALPPVAPDPVLKGMEVVLSKTIKHVSIKTYYEKLWSEGNGTDEESFYGPWLDKEGCFAISVGDWEFAEKGSEGFLNEWCKERYQQKRLVTFKFNRQSHLYIGPPVADVKQTQYCRVEGNDRCALAISGTFDGIPYADTFGVEMRWSARRKGANDVIVDVGLHVEFKKNTLLKKQIKSGTIAETTPIHGRLFEEARKVCSIGVEGAVEPVEEEEEEEEKAIVQKEEKGMLEVLLEMLPIDKNALFGAAGAAAIFLAWKSFSFQFFGGQRTSSAGDVADLYGRIDQLQAEVRLVQVSVDQILALLKEKNN